jgi:hypothetical protein
MQRPRHPGYLRAIIKLSILLLALLALAGCREDRDGSQASSAVQYQRMLDSSGKRVVIVDAQGDAVAKLRKRTRKYKVYDAEFAPVGFVSWESSEQPDGAEAVVVARSLAKDDAQAIEQVSEGTYELGAKLRIERTDRGWAIFGPDAKLVGLFERGDADEWRLRPSYEGGSFFEAETSEAGRSLTLDGETILELRAGELSSLELLSVELDGLPMLHRMAVGVWMERARPGAG